MLPLARCNHVDLTAPRCKRSCVLAADPKQDHFGYVPKIKAHATAIGAAILPNLVPDDIGFVSEAPRPQDLYAFWEKGIWNPKIKMSYVIRNLFYGQRSDFCERHSSIAAEPFVFRRNFSGGVLKTPRRVCHDRLKTPACGESQKIGRRVG